jgi:heat shock protein HslJ
MSRYNHLLLTLLSAALFLFAACGPAVTPLPIATTAGRPATPTPQVSIPLEGTEWVLSSLRGDEIVGGKSWTLGFFPDDYMEGKAGCNHYGTDYAADGQDFHVSEIHRTDSSCEEPPGVMAQDQAFFEALASVASYRASEDRLEFDDPGGETVLVYTRKLPAAVDPALQDTEWLLTSLAGGGLVADSRITLNFGAEGFEGFAGCNEYGGEYEAADKGALLMSDILRSLLLCDSPQGIMEQEGAYIHALSSSAAYRLTDGRLGIADDRGEAVLVFTRKEEFVTDPRALLGTAWRLVSIDGERLSGGSIVTLDFFTGSILGGHLGCRDYLVVYQTSGDNLTVRSETMFDAGCRTEDADPELEAQVLNILSIKSDLRLGEGQLAILGEKGGELVFEPLPEQAGLDLEGTTWTLISFVGPDPYVEEPDPWPFPESLLAGTTVDLTMEGGAARGSAGCNSYGASYSRAASSLRFGTITSTERACLEPAGLMEQEAHYLDRLVAVTAYHIYGDHVWLDTSDGQALVFFAAGR